MDIKWETLQDSGGKIGQIMLCKKNKTKHILIIMLGIEKDYGEINSL